MNLIRDFRFESEIVLMELFLKDQMIYPKHLVIETVAGFCPARCVMCIIGESPRKKVMDNTTFATILHKFSPYRKHLEYTTLHGLGEPLLDKKIVDKVRMAKEGGFPSVGFATIAMNLNDDLAIRLLEAGLDTVIFSVDGIKKETHESIRIGADFDAAVENIENFIIRRNSLGNTKIIVRMVRQETNCDEWPAYSEFWQSRLEGRFGDQVSVLDVHNWGGDHGSDVKERLAWAARENLVLCSELSERYYVYVDGRVGLCCADQQGWFPLGSVMEEDPIEIYNRGYFADYREKMFAGKIGQLPHCSSCSLVLSHIDKEYLDVG